jgi:hypothetical protein
MEMKTFQNMAAAFSPKIAIRIRGRHGIGKSQSVYQIAKKLGLEVVERRLSQMTEGDILGLPILEKGSTQFKPCDWLIDCCDNPRLLFLDELNRALPGVEQATFQLADSRKFYGYELHPQTRIIIAENIGDQYQVQSSDPAAISRYAVVDLDPSVEEWLEFASENCDPALVEFIRATPKFLEHTANAYENNKKYADRRAWHRLDGELRSCEIMDDPTNELFYAMCLSMVGAEPAMAYVKFCKERDQQISAKDILTNWAKAKKKMGRNTNEKFVDAIGKLSDYLKANLLEQKQAEQFAKFMEDCPAEPRMAAWSALNLNIQNLFLVHPYVEELMVATATGALAQQEAGENTKENEDK